MCREEGPNPSSGLGSERAMRERNRPRRDWRRPPTSSLGRRVLQSAQAALLYRVLLIILPSAFPPRQHLVGELKNNRLGFLWLLKRALPSTVISPATPPTPPSPFSLRLARIGCRGRVRKNHRVGVGRRADEARETVQSWSIELVTVLRFPLQITLVCRSVGSLRMQVSTFQVWVCVQSQLLDQKPLGDLIHLRGCTWH